MDANLEASRTEPPVKDPIQSDGLEARLPEAEPQPFSAEPGEWPNRLAARHLESIANTGFIFRNQVGSIAAATAPRLPANLPGGLAYLNAIDDLVNEGRDESRVRPNISVKPPGPHKPGVTFEIAIPPEQTINPYDLARTVYIAMPKAEIVVRPYFEPMPLEDLLARPSSKMSHLTIGVRIDGQDFCEIDATLGDDKRDAKLEIAAMMPDASAIVAPIYRELVGGSIDKQDFDPELVKLACETEAVLPVSTDLQRMIPKRLSRDEQTHLDEQMETLQQYGRSLRAKLDGQAPAAEPAPVVPTTPSLTPKQWEQAAVAMAAIASSKPPGFAPDREIGIAVDGAVMTFSPIDAPRSTALSKALGIIGDPIGALARVAGLTREPGDMRLVRIFAQSGPIENVRAFLENMAVADPGATVAPRGVKLGYDDFWKLGGPPELLLGNCSNLELRSRNGVQTLIELGEPSGSFAEIVGRNFPAGDALQARIAELTMESERTGLISLHSRRALKRLAEHAGTPKYAKAELGKELPKALVFSQSDGLDPFARARRILISSTDKIFGPEPVSSREAALNLAKQLGNVLEAVRASAVDPNAAAPAGMK